jgi:hypothetical protein
MSDWKKWDELLGGGHGETVSYGLTAKDGAGKESSLVIRRRTKAPGRAIFELFINPQSVFGKPPGGPPTSAKIVSLEVEGFVGKGCEGRKSCAQFKLIPPGTILIGPTPGSKFTFEPTDHDSGELSKLLAACSCGEAEESYRTYVTVEILPEPATRMRFTCCDECDDDPATLD